MDVVSAKVLAAQMLGVPSMEALAREQVRRALLPGGRVEAHEYGRKQHSSASAGGVLIGLAGSAAVSDSIVAPLVSVVAGLVDDEGRVRSHDGDAEAGGSTWAEARVLLGLLLRPQLVSDQAKLDALAKRLLSLRDENGGWPLRAGEPASVAFTFYPVLALMRAFGLGMNGTREALVVTARYLEDQLRGRHFEIAEQLMAHFALERIAKACACAAGCRLSARRGPFSAVS